MKDLQPTCRLAVIQAAPVLFDKRKGLEKRSRSSSGPSGNTRRR